MFGVWFLELLYTFESGVCKLQVDLYLTAQIIKPTACCSIFVYKWSFFSIGGSSLKGLDVLYFAIWLQSHFTFQVVITILLQCNENTVASRFIIGHIVYSLTFLWRPNSVHNIDKTALRFNREQKRKGCNTSWSLREGCLSIIT